MKQTSSINIRRCFEILFLIFTALFFLSLGADFPGHYLLRTWFAAGLLLAFWISIRKQYQPLRLVVCWPFLLFSLFWFFLMIRAFVAFYLLKSGQANADISDVLLEKQVVSPVRWTILILTFVLAYGIFARRSSVQLLQILYVGMGVFLASNCLPALLLFGETVYKPEGSLPGFFFPFFYFHPLVEEYILARIGHTNYLGDIMSFGFFATLGGIFYSLQTCADELKSGKSIGKVLQGYDWPRILLNLTFAAVLAITIILLFSRGTIGSFLIATVAFFSFVLIRFRSKISWIFSVSILLISVAFVASAIDLDAFQKEMGTLQSEIEHADKDVRHAVYKSKSIYTNREGAKRALRIFMDYPLWGVGTDGYREVAKNYETIEGGGRQFLTNYEAMSHYFHLLAEEGVGAFIYYAFLVVYGVFFLFRLFKVRSRFQFIVGISLFAPVFMVLGHAVMNQLMQRFSMSMIIYITMGASLAVLRDDFEHDL